MDRIAFSILERSHGAARLMLGFFVLLLALSPLPSMNQAQLSALIRGSVKDQKGGALPGANIVVVGTSIGTATNVNGYFELAIPVFLIGVAPSGATDPARETIGFRKS